LSIPARVSQVTSRLCDASCPVLCSVAATAHKTRTDVGQPVDSRHYKIAFKCHKFSTLAQISFKAGRTGITRGLIKRAIGALSNNRAELAIPAK
jgi:peptidyl-tRNA hydrolase